MPGAENKRLSLWATNNRAMLSLLSKTYTNWVGVSVHARQKNWVDVPVHAPQKKKVSNKLGGGMNALKFSLGYQKTGH